MTENQTPTGMRPVPGMDLVAPTGWRRGPVGHEKPENSRRPDGHLLSDAEAPRAPNERRP